MEVRRNNKIFRKFYLSLFSLLLCLMICFESATVKYIAEPIYHYDVRKDLSVYFTNADEVIAEIRKCLHRHDWHIIVSFNSHSDNMDDIDEIICELMDYAVAETDNPTEGDYIRYQYGGYDLNYTQKINGDTYYYTVEVIPNYYTKPAQEEKVSDKISEILDSYHFTKNTSDYQKFFTIYNYIYDNVKYDKVHKNDKNNHLKTTAYSALFYKTAVCQGYCVLLYRMLREVGINTRIITGMALYDDTEEFHSWNIVELDGLYYNVDITWDKQSKNKDYFLKCDSDFDSHKRDPQFSTKEFYTQYPMSKKNYFIN